MLFNTMFLIYGVVIDRQENKRLKNIQATKLEYEKAVKAYFEEVKAIEEEEKLADEAEERRKREESASLPVIQEESEGESCSDSESSESKRESPSKISNISEIILNTTQLIKSNAIADDRILIG